MSEEVFLTPQETTQSTRLDARLPYRALRFEAVGHVSLRLGNIYDLKRE